MTLNTEEVRCTGNERHLELEMLVSVQEQDLRFYVYHLSSASGKLLTVSPESMLDRGEVTILERYDSLEEASDSEFLQCFVLLDQMSDAFLERLMSRI